MKARLRVLVVHLNDEFTGAARIASQTATALARAGHEVSCLVGDNGSNGFVRQAHQADTVPYRFANSRLLTLWYFVRAQVSMYRYVARACSTNRVDLVWVHTVLPVGAALAARLHGRPVVAHLHEVSLGTPSLFAVLWSILKLTATHLVCVSRYVAETLHTAPERTTILHNALEKSDAVRATTIATSLRQRGNSPFVVMMAASLRWYKGIDSFLALADRFATTADVRFLLVLGCSHNEFARFAATEQRDGLELVHHPASIYDHYAQADLVVNLSHAEGWIETFGLTLLEAMSCGVPVVSPTRGGCTELFIHGQGGWLIDSRDLISLEALVRSLVADQLLHSAACKAALEASYSFDPKRWEAEVDRLAQGTQ